VGKKPKVLKASGVNDQDLNEREVVNTGGGKYKMHFDSES